MTQFIFYQFKDSIGHDIDYEPNMSIEELKESCKKNKKCIGFNTLGYKKYFICKKKNLIIVPDFKQESDGLYVNQKRYNKMKSRIKNKYYIGFEDYTFYKNKDSTGNDIVQIPNKSIEELKILCDEDQYCIGFNTIGFLKYTINYEKNFVNVPFDGLYIKNNKFRIKLICNWTSSKELCEDWNRMSKGNNKWNDIECTSEDKEIDFYVIINKPSTSSYIPERTIIFQMEPWCPNPNQNWGIKTWNEWSEPSEEKFLQVRSHKKYFNNCFWQLSMTYNDLKTIKITKTKLLSTICSSKYYDPGHIKRIEFMKYVDNKKDDIVIMDIWNSDNIHEFKNYKGPHPINNKEIGMIPYKYYFMAENNQEHNFITEKIWEPLITDTLCFYWGCPNISDYIDPKAYIELDLDNFEKSFEIIKNAIINNEWEKRIEVIRREKQKVLEYFNFYPTLERIIKHEYKFNYKPSDQEITYHKYFKDIINQEINNICFIHSCTINNNTKILEKLINKITKSGLINKLDYLYIINLGDEININNIYKEKIKIISYSKNIKLYEKPTINLLAKFSKFNKNTKILYLHTKGVSYDITCQNIIDWVNLMINFLVKDYEYCLNLLDEYDCIGCNYMDKPYPHFSGNFWWANSNYINKLDNITSNDRHECEWWICSNKNVKKYSIYNSNINHYQQLYPKYEYDNMKKFDKFTNIICLNLEKRKDRKEYIKKILTETKLLEFSNFFNAIDGQKLLPTDELIKIFINNDFGSRKSFIGCALSHLEIWKQLIADDKYEKYLILEDDIIFVDNIRSKLNQLYKKLRKIEWDIVYLGFHCKKSKIEKYEKYLYQIKYMTIIPYKIKWTIGGLFGYIITKSGALKLKKFIDENGIKHGIDYLMFYYADTIGLNHYQVLPPLILSEFADGLNSVDSNIQYDFDTLF